MPVRVKLPAKAASPRSKPQRFSISLKKALLFGAIGAVAIAIILLASSYAKYARLTDEKLARGPFPNSSLLYAAPGIVGIGDPGTPLQYAAKLRESGYIEDARTNRAGWYHLRPDAI